MVHVLTPEQEDVLTSSFSPVPILTLRRLDGVILGTPEVVGGTLTLSASNAERQSLDVTLGGEWSPEEWDDPVMPTNVAILVDYDLGVGPPVRVGEVWIDTVATTLPTAQVRVSAYSLERRVSQAGLAKSRYNGTVATVARAIVEDALGRVVPFFAQGGMSAPVVAAEQVFTGDAWDAVDGLTDSAGGEAFFDSTGTLTVRAIRAVGAPALIAKTGEGGNLIDYTSTLTRDGSANRARLVFHDPKGDAADVVGTASGTGSAAWDGLLGRMRYSEEKTGKVTSTQANDAAAAYLLRAGGLLRSVNLTLTPDPRLETGDTIQVVFADGGTEEHVVIGVTLPLGLDSPMTVATRVTPWSPS